MNDVVLATIAGALRGWLLTRSESMAGVRQLRAVVPMSVIDDELEATSLGSQIAPHYVDLPIGEASPVVRLRAGVLLVPGAQGHRPGRRRQPARRDRRLRAHHVPRARVPGRGRGGARKGFHLSVTNVPGPQFPLYAAGAQMVETYPVHPLLPGHALAIGVTSYDGGVYYGITADRDLLPDVDVLGQCITDALEELDETVRAARRRPARGRKPAAKKQKAP